MNHYFNQLINYHKIHQQKLSSKHPSQITSFLGMDARIWKIYSHRHPEDNFLNISSIFISSEKGN